MLRHESLLEVLQCLFDLRLEPIIESLLLHDGVQKFCVHRFHVFVEFGLKFSNLLDLKIIQIAIGTGKNDENLFAEW